MGALALAALLVAGSPALAADGYRKVPATTQSSPTDAKAVAELMQAAGLGHVRAQVALAGRYLAGKGVKRNIPEAMRWYGQAAEHGDGEAFFKLGAINERGGAKAKAYACFLLAAQLGNGNIPSRARAALAYMAPKLGAQARHDAEELAAAWRMTIDH